MPSKFVDNMTTSFIYTMIRLYLDYPGIGEFSWQQIKDNLPNKGYYFDVQYPITKENYESGIASIMKEARERDVYIVRKRGYYKIVNIREVLERYSKRQGIAPPSFKTPAINKTIWGGRDG